MQYQHLLLGDRKALGLRLLTLEAAKTCSQENADWGEFAIWPRDDRIAWRQVRDNLNREADEQAPPGDRGQNGVQLDQLLDRLVTQYVPLPREGQSYLDQALRSIRNVARRMDCENCVTSTKRTDLRPCYGHPKNDPEVVALGGDCIYPIRDAARHSLDLAKALYAEATGLRDIEAVFSTMPGAPGALRGQRITATGELHWHDEGDKRLVAVEVTVNTREFDDRGLNILPYCLAHELLCHAFQQTATNGPRTRDHNDEYDALAEGWMDYLVAELLRRGPTPWDDPDVADTADLIHSLRKDTTEPPPGSEQFPHAGRVRYGSQAAEAVLALFERHEPPEGVRQGPWLDFVALSCQLNAHPWSATERNSALMKVPRRLGRTPPDMGLLKAFRKPPAVDRDLVDALLKWRVSRGKRPWRDAVDEVLRQLTRK